MTVHSRTGLPQLNYTPSDFDRAHTLEGVVAIAKLLYVMGATEIRVNFPTLVPFLRPSSSANPKEGDGDEEAFHNWLETLKQLDNKPPVAIWTSAHQMGTCRMSSSPSMGVVDPEGKVWDTENLYVADASVFPSASGVNPMSTNMAIADMIADCVAENLATQA